MIPAVRVLEVRDAVVTAGVSAFRIGDELYLSHEEGTDERRELPAIATGDFVTESFAILRNRPTIDIPSGTFVSGGGCDNYYHFVTEIASKLFYLRPKPNEELLVAGITANIPQLLEVLSFFRPDAKIRILESGHDYRVDRLTWITETSHTPYNLLPGKWPTCDDTFLDPKPLGLLRSEVLSRVRRSTRHSSPGRVFLSRPQERRSYNKSEVQELLVDFGFVPMAMEEMSVLEQASVFHSADLVVGPSGAAWTNLLFGKFGGRAIYWIAEPLSEFSAWAALAAIAGVDVAFLAHASSIESTAGAYSGSYEVSIPILEQALRSWLP